MKLWWPIRVSKYVAKLSSVINIAILSILSVLHCRYFNDFPIYCSEAGNKELPSTTELAELLINPPQEFVVNQKPIGCQMNAMFLVNTSGFAHRKDILSDELGSFKNQKTDTRYINYVDGNCSQVETSATSHYVMKVTYYKHRAYGTFRRRLVEMTEKQTNKPCPVVLLQYKYDNVPWFLSETFELTAKPIVMKCYLYRVKLRIELMSSGRNEWNCVLPNKLELHE